MRLTLIPVSQGSSPRSGGRKPLLHGLIQQTDTSIHLVYKPDELDYRVNPLQTQLLFRWVMSE